MGAGARLSRPRMGSHRTMNRPFGSLKVTERRIVVPRELEDRSRSQLPLHKGIVGELAVPVPPEFQAVSLNGDSLIGPAHAAENRGSADVVLRVPVGTVINP